MATPFTPADQAEGWDEQATMLRRLADAASSADIAARIGRDLLSLDGLDRVVLVALDPEARVIAMGRPVPEPFASRIRARLAGGPWVGPWDLPLGPPMAPRESRVASPAMAVVPMREGPRVMGGLILGTHREGGLRWLAGRMPALESFAAVAGASLVAGSSGLADRHHVEAQLDAVLAGRAFDPVFQPIVALETGLAVGHEALTRFHDGTRPDRRFAAAAAAGRGPELEQACLEAAIEASQALPPGPWLALNVSPDLVLGGPRLRRLLARASRPIVLEVAAHAPIDDHRAFRRAVASLGRGVRLAVDDAEASAATLRRIVALRPDLVKVDMGLVHGLERDVARQGHVAALVHVTTRHRGALVAEGIERPEEQAALRALGVTLGQGFLLGRPAPVVSVAGLDPRPGAAGTIGLS